MNSQQEKWEVKAKRHYEEAKAAPPVSLVDALKAARQFVDQHSESWYFSGQELLGKIDGALEAAAKGEPT